MIRGDWAGFEELFKLPDFIYYTARGGERLDHLGEMDFDLPGLRHAVQGFAPGDTIRIVDEGWKAVFRRAGRAQRRSRATPGP